MNALHAMPPGSTALQQPERVGDHPRVQDNQLPGCPWHPSLSDLGAAEARIPDDLAHSCKVYRVGLVTAGAPETGVLGPGMARNFTKRGYIVDQNLVFERRAAQG